jgi:hypothetical protein
MRFTTVAFAASAMFAALVVPLQLAAQGVDGTGTAYVVTRWIDSNTVANSHISDYNYVITVNGALMVTGKPGADSTVAGTPQAGGSNQLLSGRGGSINSGSGIIANGGRGASIYMSGGGGATCIFVGSPRCAFTGGNGGSISVDPGYGGPAPVSGHFGSVNLASGGGNVGIGLSNPGRTLEVKMGGTTLADEWTLRSSRRFKTNIQPLQDALARVKALQGVSYERKSDGKHEIGVVAEDVDRVIPEVVAHDPETHEVEGVDYSRLVALLIEAVKSQQAEIELLNSQMAKLIANAAKQ